MYSGFSFSLYYVSLSQSLSFFIYACEHDLSISLQRIYQAITHLTSARVFRKKTIANKSILHTRERERENLSHFNAYTILMRYYKNKKGFSEKIYRIPAREEDRICLILMRIQFQISFSIARSVRPTCPDTLGLEFPLLRNSDKKI